MVHIIHSARRIDLSLAAAPGSPAPLGRDWVATDRGRLLAEGVGSSWTALLPESVAQLLPSHSPALLDAAGPASSVHVTDANGHALTAGWVDQHCHGAAGTSFDDDRDPGPAVALHRAHGTRQLVASLVTHPLDGGVAAAGRLAAAVELDPTLAGIHLEGPFLDPGRRGAHAAQFLRPADLADVQRLYDACGGRLLQITLAPERDHALEATRWLADRGVAVAVGHSNCSYDQAMAAFDAGASVLTHALNAMPGLHHRDPGPAGAALDSSHVTLELIADLVHVHPTLLRVLFSAAPGRVALVTDAMSAAGSGDGAYTLGSLAVTVRDGVARLDRGGAIAGSTLTMDQAVLRAVSCGISASEAITAATLTPAWAMGLKAFPAAGEALDAFLVDAAGVSTAVQANTAGVTPR